MTDKLDGERAYHPPLDHTEVEVVMPVWAWQGVRQVLRGETTEVDVMQMLDVLLERRLKNTQIKALARADQLGGAIGDLEGQLDDVRRRLRELDEEEG